MHLEAPICLIGLSRFIIGILLPSLTSDHNTSSSVRVGPLSGEEEKQFAALMHIGFRHSGQQDLALAMSPRSMRQAQQEAQGNSAGETTSPSIEDMNKELATVQQELLDSPRRSPQRKRLQKEASALDAKIDATVKASTSSLHERQGASC